MSYWIPIPGMMKGIRAEMVSVSKKRRNRKEKLRKKISENHVDVSGENNPGYGKKPRPWMDGEANPSKRPEVKLKQQLAASKRQRDKFGRFIKKG